MCLYHASARSSSSSSSSTGGTVKFTSGLFRCRCAHAETFEYPLWNSPPYLGSKRPITFTMCGAHFYSTLAEYLPDALLVYEVFPNLGQFSAHCGRAYQMFTDASIFRNSAWSFSTCAGFSAHVSWVQIHAWSKTLTNAFVT